ncbi:MAG: hypothetical protein M5U34_00270 [Chloroflexi bacterium]|nr:hypothetical protein [Chloroflexota bacterium]
MLKQNRVLSIFYIISLVFIAIFILLYRAAAQPQNTGFLHPPYFGSTSVNAIFDHEYPRYDDEIEYANGDVLTITTYLMHNNGIRYQNDINNIPGYSGHDGIDYDLRYEYVLASHAGRVLEAGWDSPAHPANPACQLPANQNGQESNLAGEYWYGVSG